MAHVLFDVNGTLLDPRALTEGWPGAPAGLGLSVLDQTVAQAMTDTITGGFRPFTDYLRAALALRAELAGLGDDYVEAGMAAAAALPPYPDAADALARLRLAGHTPSALTNSAADAARSALSKAGLLEHMHAVVSVEAVGAFKPDQRVYAHALEVLATPAPETWFVAGHWWDVWAAKRAGLRTGWVGRDEGALLGTVPEPDVRAPDLAGVADAIASAGA
ncbi:MAG TPA: HAD-IA family hydrolase [Solirubrobacteraceae bacterium]|nr:HAD-IA family hydrolase [Solirubrobacteraceae bacterium]